MKSLFARPYFRETYINYNSDTPKSTKHTCSAGKYLDYCCGSIHKENKLFKKYPNSLQLQLFVDGFEPCDGLKPKAGLHGQIAIYCAITMSRI